MVSGWHGMLADAQPGGWPALLAGLILGVYWARVLKMALKARRSHHGGHAGHLLPPEQLGRKLRLVWVPVVLLWILLPLLMWGQIGPPVVTRPLHGSQVVAVAGVVVMAAALVTTWACWRRMGRHWRMGIDPGETNALLTSGPWGYVRHPIYSLSILMAGATWLAAPSGPLLPVILVHILLIIWESAREEEHLVRTHGQAYLDYQKLTGRLVPRLKR